MAFKKYDLTKLRSAFDQKAGGGDQNWKLFFPFWKIPENTTAIVRFLPDLDENNGMIFLVENFAHELLVNGEKKKVPCLSMYEEPCPICELSRKYYDEKSPEGDQMGSKYWKKRSYLGQVIVIESPIEHDQNALVKLIEFGPKVFKVMQSAFQSGDLENAPCDYKGGYNFRFKKTKSGQYADYGTSSFSPKMSDLADDVINQIKLYDLKTFRTARMDRATLEAMLLADTTGRPYKQTTEAVEEPSQPVTQPSTVSVGRGPMTVEEPKAAPAAAATTAAPVEVAAPAATKPPMTGKAQGVLDNLRARYQPAQKPQE